MKQWRRLTGSIFLTLAIELLVSPGVMLAQSAAVPLRLGDPLPDVVGQNLLGSPTHLSTTLGGKVCCRHLFLQQGRRQGHPALEQGTSERLRLQSSVALSTVIMLESAPRLLRGVILSGIKNDIPTSLRGSTIVSYEDEKLWKQRLAVADDSHAYALLLGQEGRIRWMCSGAFSDANYRELSMSIQQQLHSSTPRKFQ